MTGNRNPSPMASRKTPEKLNTRRPYTERQRLTIMRNAAHQGIKPAVRKAGMAGDRTCREWIDLRLGTWQEMLSDAVSSGSVAAKRIALRYHVDPQTGNIMRRLVDGVKRKEQDATPYQMPEGPNPSLGQTLAHRVARLEAEVARLTAITDRL